MNDCIRCTSPATEGKMCAVHAEANRQNTRAVRARRRALGLCIRCERPMVRASYCERHLKIVGVENKITHDRIRAAKTAEAS